MQKFDLRGSLDAELSDSVREDEGSDLMGESRMKLGVGIWTLPSSLLRSVKESLSELCSIGDFSDVCLVRESLNLLDSFKDSPGSILRFLS